MKSTERIRETSSLWDNRSRPSDQFQKSALSELDESQIPRMLLHNFSWSLQLQYSQPTEKLKLSAHHSTKHG